ncbi:MAG: alpha/beta fold hydrolase [Myxococcota bacterium]|nr:alpha/beta fold hydrolase [Myxococcota bacterium]
MTLIVNGIMLVSIGTAVFCVLANIFRSLTLSERPKFSAEYISAELQEFILTVSVVLLGWIGWFDRSLEPSLGHKNQPIILVPGYGMNRLSLWFLKVYLQQQGYRWVWNINHPVRQDDLDAYATALCHKAEHLCFRSGESSVILIAHSMGGLVSRLAIQKKPSQFKALISLGTPWKSTAAHIFTIGRSGQQMSPSSPHLCHTWDQKVPLHSIYSLQDWVILPPTHSIVDGANNHHLSNVGHLSLLCSTRSFTLILTIIEAETLCKEANCSS